MLLLRRALALVSAACSLVCATIFYTSYWQWRHLFENGRYFDEVESVVYHEDSVFYAMPTVAFALLALLLWVTIKRVPAVSRVSAHHTRAFSRGFIIAPLTMPIVFIVAPFFIALFDSKPLADHLSWGFWNASASEVFTVYVISAPLVYAFGVPTVLWLKRTGRLNWSKVCAASTLLGAVGFLALVTAVSNKSFAAFEPRYFGADVIQPLAMGAACGVVIGIVFCLAIGLKSTRVNKNGQLLNQHP